MIVFLISIWIFKLFSVCEIAYFQNILLRHKKKPAKYTSKPHILYTKIPKYNWLTFHSHSQCAGREIRIGSSSFPSRWHRINSTADSIRSLDWSSSRTIVQLSRRKCSHDWRHFFSASWYWSNSWKKNCNNFVCRLSHRLNTTVKFRSEIQSKNSRLCLTRAHQICGYHRRNVVSPILHVVRRPSIIQATRLIAIFVCNNLIEHRVNLYLLMFFFFL